MKKITKKYNQYEIIFDGKNFNEICEFINKFNRKRYWLEVAITFNNDGELEFVEIKRVADLMLFAGDTLIYDEKSTKFSKKEKNNRKESINNE